MPRSNQTKRLLAQSLMDLMTTTPLEKISVNDIVDHAGVGRNTFYYHFEDKYDLVNWYFQSGVTQFLVERSAYASWNALLEAVEDYLLENKVFYCNALAYTGQNSLQQYIFDYLSSIFMQRAKELRPDKESAFVIRILRLRGYSPVCSCSGKVCPSCRALPHTALSEMRWLR